MEEKQVRFYLEAKKIKTNDGKSFMAFKTPIGKLNLDVKFRKDCKDIPKRSGFFQCETSRLNLDTNGAYPCLWVRPIGE